MMEYAIDVLKREQERLSVEMQLSGPGPDVMFDQRGKKLESLEKAIKVLTTKRKEND